MVAVVVVVMLYMWCFGWGPWKTAAWVVRAAVSGGCSTLGQGIHACAPAAALALMFLFPPPPPCRPFCWRTPHSPLVQVLRAPKTALQEHFSRLPALPSRDITIDRFMSFQGAAVLLVRQLASCGAAYAVCFGAASTAAACRAIACLADSLRGLEGVEVLVVMEVDWVMLSNGTRLKVRGGTGRDGTATLLLPAILGLLAHAVSGGLGLHGQARVEGGGRVSYEASRSVLAAWAPVR